MAVPQLDIPTKIGDVFRLELLFREGDGPNGPWTPLDLSDVEQVEFSLGQKHAKSTHIYLSTDPDPLVVLDTETIEAQTFYVVRVTIPAPVTRTWPKPMNDLPGLPFEVTLAWSPDERVSYMGGHLIVDPEVANEAAL